MEILNYFTIPERKPSNLNGKEIKISPCFNIHAKLQELFHGIKPNSIVRGAMYMWGMETPTEWLEIPGNPRSLTYAFLEKAIKSDTKLILDGFNSKFSEETTNLLEGNISTKITQILKKSDPGFRKKLLRSFKHRFNNKDEKNLGYMHEKFFLFSELDIGKEVVVQMTANLNLRQYLQFNSMTVLINAGEIYKNYLNYWDCLWNNWKILPEFDNPYIFPRKFCPIATKLQQILEEKSQKEILIAMCYFTRKDIAKLLLDLKEAGCIVKIIVSQEYENLKIINYLKPKVIRNKDWLGKMHNKFMLVDNTVYFGSYNLTKPALRENNETLLKIEDENCYQEYRDYFLKLLTMRQLFR